MPSSFHRNAQWHDLLSEIPHCCPVALRRVAARILWTQRQLYEADEWQNWRPTFETVLRDTWILDVVNDIMAK